MKNCNVTQNSKRQKNVHIFSIHRIHWNAEQIEFSFKSERKLKSMISEKCKVTILIERILQSSMPFFLNIFFFVFCFYFKKILLDFTLFNFIALLVIIHNFWLTIKITYTHHLIRNRVHTDSPFWCLFSFISSIFLFFLSISFLFQFGHSHAKQLRSKCSVLSETKAKETNWEEKMK